MSGMLRRAAACGVVALLALVTVPLGGATATDRPLEQRGAFVEPAARAAIEAAGPADAISVIVRLREQADLGSGGTGSRAERLAAVVNALQGKADSSQRDLLAFLREGRRQGRVSQVRPFWIFNGLAVTATPSVIQELAARPDVLGITADGIIPEPALAAPVSGDDTTPEANLSLVHVPPVWELGFRGRGVVIASMDSGVDASHPDLEVRWRGGANSWFDPNGEHPLVPADVSGHGTWTTGVAVAGEAGGTSVGMAPDAKWIAVKIFDDSGVARVSGIHAGFQWLLDPDGDPATPDAPHVVNNSWGYADPGCNLEFQPDLQVLRAVDIVPVFAGGNSGPAAGTGVSPANYPEALAAGATDSSDVVAGFSSRGPSSCGEAETAFPELVAPGVGIRTTDLYGGYYSATGTSLAAPHVTGALAVLLSAFPSLRPGEIEEALLRSAVDLGPTGPDNDYGQGRLDVFAAFGLLAAEHGTPVLMGDVDCDREVTSSDASAISHVVVGLMAALPCPEATDVDRDGRAAMRDALLVGRLAADLIDNFPPP